MRKSIKLKNDNYLDSTSIVHEKELLSEIIKSKGTILWEGTTQAEIITLKDKPNKYKYFKVTTASGYIGIILACLNSSVQLGKSIVEDNKYCRYECYIRINLYDNEKNWIRFDPTWLFKDGSYSANNPIVKIEGLK